MGLPHNKLDRGNTDQLYVPVQADKAITMAIRIIIVLLLSWHDHARHGQLEAMFVDTT